MLINVKFTPPCFFIYAFKEYLPFIFCFYLLVNYITYNLIYRLHPIKSKKSFVSIIIAIISTLCPFVFFHIFLITAISPIIIFILSTLATSSVIVLTGKFILKRDGNYFKIRFYFIIIALNLPYLYLFN